MTDTPFRDHSRLCEHGSRDAHDYEVQDTGHHAWSCPGGAVMTRDDVVRWLLDNDGVDRHAALRQYLHIAWARDGMGPLAETYGQEEISPGVSVPRKSNDQEAWSIVLAALGVFDAD